MKKLITTLLFIYSTVSNAALIDKGDYVTDTNYGKDWLKLNILNGFAYSDVLAGIHGYTTDGWRYATKDDLLSLVTNYVGPSTGAYPGFPTSHYSTEALSNAIYLVTAMGMNTAFNDSRAVYNITGDVYEGLHQITLQGFFDSGIDANVPGLAEISASISIDPGANLGSLPFPSGRWLISETRYTQFPNDPVPYGPYVSSFLVRDVAVVPESQIVSLLAIGLVILPLFARRKKSSD
jgi:hypothetical protein